MNVFKRIVTNAKRHRIELGIAAVAIVGLVLTIVWWPKAELIGALEASESSAESVAERLGDRLMEAILLASREKLRLWGLLPEQIAEIEKTRKVRTHITIYSPLPVSSVGGMGVQLITFLVAPCIYCLVKESGNFAMPVLPHLKSTLGAKRCRQEL